MALDAGNIQASSGMSKAIYDQLNQNLMTSEEKNKLKTDDLKNIQDGWRKLAYSIAQGLIGYIETDLEIAGIRTSGNVSVPVNGETQAAGQDNHVHVINLTGIQNDVVFVQSNDGTGHVG